jgi:hypothetical protein
MLKFGRIYELTIEIDEKTKESVIIRNPITMQMNVTRNTLASANTANITIFNLAEKTRKRIYHDRIDTLTYRRIVLKAGYEGNSPIIFRGQLRMAYSSRQGTEWVTKIEAFDGGDAIINGFTSRTIPANVQTKDVLSKLISDMPHVNGSVIGDFTNTTSRGMALMGNSWNIAGTLIGDEGHNFIDNEKVIIKKFDECIAGDITVINSATGLLETPQRQDERLDIKMLFEPRIVIGQIIELQCLETIFNGQYEVIGFQHTGIISESQGGACTTTMNLWLGTKLLRVINP